MYNVGKKIVKFRVPIFIISLLLLVPALFGMIKTRINYDILYYLPDSIETMQGQDILAEQFGTGAYSMFICEGMETKDVSALKAKLEQVEHVEKVVWYDSLMDISIPMDMLPDKVKDFFNTDDSTMMFIIFDTTTSADETMEAIKEIRSIAGTQCFLSGMSAIVTDTKDLSDQEVVIYVVIAVILSAIVLAIAMDSFFIPIVFLMGIGMAIIYNLGTNIFLGEISYITKALTAVLQLGVTMDYSIFLWHSYQEQLEQNEDRKDAMAWAIAATIKSVVGSSFTTVAGFIALCFMSFTLGLDLGIVMAKGVVIGVICCVTVLPSMIMIFDKVLEKTKHRPFLPNMDRISDFITKHYKVFVLLLILLIVPAYYCQQHAGVYYNLDETLPDDLPSIMANTKLQEEYDMGALHMLLVDSSLSSKEIRAMASEMEEVDGVKAVLGLETLLGSRIPDSMIPDSVKEMLENENYKLLLIDNQYKVASDEVNEQITQLNTILKKYDPTGMLVGEAPCTKDLITITDQDFKVVNAVSILAVFVIIIFVFKSWFLPIILVATIEFAIFINLGIPYLTGTTIPFIASIVIGTIQLGSTVDYAILMTSRYELERGSGRGKKESIQIAHRASMKSIMVSALSFFAATFGVGLYSNIDMISSLCTLMARGALISMVVVLCVLPSMFMVFDKIICKSSKNFKRGAKQNEQK
jgi:hypothetical protein